MFYVISVSGAFGWDDNYAPINVNPVGGGGGGEGECGHGVGFLPIFNFF